MWARRRLVIAPGPAAHRHAPRAAEPRAPASPTSGSSSSSTTPRTASRCWTPRAPIIRVNISHGGARRPDPPDMVGPPRSTSFETTGRGRDRGPPRPAASTAASRLEHVGVHAARLRRQRRPRGPEQHRRRSTRQMGRDRDGQRRRRLRPPALPRPPRPPRRPRRAHRPRQPPPLRDRAPAAPRPLPALRPDRRAPAARPRQLQAGQRHASATTPATSCSSPSRGLLRRSDPQTPTSWPGSAATSSPSCSPTATRPAPQRVAGLVVERIRDHAATLDGVARRVTASVGAVTFQAAAEHAADVLALADMTMYDAKEAGRNQVVGPARGRPAWPPHRGPAAVAEPHRGGPRSTTASSCTSSRS